MTPLRVQVAMYGTSLDMSHTLERYGPNTIDARVEPAGLNALHVAIRRGAFKIVKVGAKPSPSGSRRLSNYRPPNTCFVCHL